MRGVNGWSESHFEVSSLNYVPSAIGKELSERGLSGPEIAGMPRTIDAISAVLTKIGPKKDGDGGGFCWSRRLLRLSPLPMSRRLQARSFLSPAVGRNTRTVTASGS